MTITLILLAIALVGCRVLIPRLGSSVAAGVVERDGRQLLSDCPDTPNCQGSLSTRSGQRVEALRITGEVDGAIARIAESLSSQSSVAVVTQDPKYLHLTYTSKLMGYVDDVEFLLDDAAKVVQIRSASRVGQNDLGANAKRVEEIRAELEGTL